MKFFYLLLVSLSMYGCILKNTNSFPVIDLDKADGEEVLKMSDLVDNVRLIKLETRPDVLLPGRFRTWVGEKYILTFDEEIHLFAADGKYIRKITQKGRGPEEYTHIWGYAADEKEDLLYLADAKEVIYVMDLQEGKLIKRLPLMGGSPRGLLLTEDSVLTYLSVVRSNGKNIYQIGRMGTDGTWKGSINLPNQLYIYGGCYLGEDGHAIRYKMALADTVYQLQDTILIPWCRMITPLAYSEETGKGRLVDIAFENKDLMILSNDEMEVRKNNNGIFSQVRHLDPYSLRKSGFDLKKISAFYIDLFDMTKQGIFPLEVSGKKAYWNINVSQYKKILKDKLDNPLIADSLKVWYHNLNEEDNPLILVGDIR